MKKSCVCMLLILCMLTAFVGCECEHTFGEEWLSDETYHWHVCTQADCKEPSEKSEHEWDGGVVTLQPTADTDGECKYTCKTCGRTKTEILEGEPQVDDKGWANAFLMTEDNYRMTVVTNAKDSLIVKKRNGIAVAILPQAVLTTERYFVTEGEKYHCYDKKGEQVTKSEITQQQYMQETTLIALQGLAQSSFTYSEASKKYTAAKITVGDVVYENVYVSFLNGRIEMITFTSKETGKSAQTTVITVTYGTVASDLVLPEVTA